MNPDADGPDDAFFEPEYLGDRPFFEFVDLGGLPAVGTVAGRAGPCPERPEYMRREPSSLVLEVEEAWRTPYLNLTCEQVRTLLSQKMALEPLADRILEFAERYPTATVTNYSGEVGLLVLRAAEEFLRHSPARFRFWLSGDFDWMDEAFGFSRSLRREADEALAAARAAAGLR
ncbi:MAG TPA: hypothetical protein VEW26_00780 [Allosphingosinicella sp.]|nr:hypothetical protein [Allosphingosinicella sp.]